MQKRYKQGMKIGSDLPSSKRDIKVATTGRLRGLARHMKNNVAKDYDPFAEARFIGRILAVGLLIVFFFAFSFFLPQSTSRVEEIDVQILGEPQNYNDKLPLSHFRSLDYAFANADIVALYFAASWCPMSTVPTQLIKEIFPLHHDNVLPPESENVKGNGRRKRLAIVYVSSDESEEEMLEYSKHSVLMPIPYDSNDRNNLKVHFRTCAKREMEDLGIEIRRFEIPTFIVFDSLTHGILTTQGVADLQSQHQTVGDIHPSEQILSNWEFLQHTIRELEAKTE